MVRQQVRTRFLLLKKKKEEEKKHGKAKGIIHLYLGLVEEGEKTYINCPPNPPLQGEQANLPIYFFHDLPKNTHKTKDRRQKHEHALAPNRKLSTHWQIKNAGMVI